MSSARDAPSTRPRCTPDRNLARVYLGQILTALGLNIVSFGAWLLKTARAKTRFTPLARLMAKPISGIANEELAWPR